MTRDGPPAHKMPLPPLSTGPGGLARGGQSWQALSCAAGTERRGFPSPIARLCFPISLVLSREQTFWTQPVPGSSLGSALNSSVASGSLPSLEEADGPAHMVGLRAPLHTPSSLCGMRLVLPSQALCWGQRPCPVGTPCLHVSSPPRIRLRSWS